MGGVRPARTSAAHIRPQRRRLADRGIPHPWVARAVARAGVARNSVTLFPTREAKADIGIEVRRFVAVPTVKWAGGENASVITSLSTVRTQSMKEFKADSALAASC